MPWRSIARAGALLKDRLRRPRSGGPQGRPWPGRPLRAPIPSRP